MRNVDFMHFLQPDDTETTTPIQIFLSGYGMSHNHIQTLLARLQAHPQPVTLHFSSSGITEKNAVLFAQSLSTLKQPIIINFRKSGVENNMRCSSAFSAVIASNHYPVGTIIYGLNPKIQFWCETTILIFYTKMLFALSPYTTDPDNKTKSFAGFPRDIAQVIMGFLTAVPLDIAFIVREKIISERRTNKKLSVSTQFTDTDTNTFFPA